MKINFANYSTPTLKEVELKARNLLCVSPNSVTPLEEDNETFEGLFGA